MIIMHDHGCRLSRSLVKQRFDHRCVPGAAIRAWPCCYLRSRSLPNLALSPSEVRGRSALGCDAWFVRPASAMIMAAQILSILVVLSAGLARWGFAPTARTRTETRRAAPPSTDPRTLRMFLSSLLVSERYAASGGTRRCYEKLTEAGSHSKSVQNHRLFSFLRVSLQLFLRPFISRRPSVPSRARHMSRPEARLCRCYALSPCVRGR
jgi:hypothetical protein